MSTPVESVDLETPLREAAKKMQRKDIGDVLVLDATGQVQGIVTDRDVAIRSVAEERNASTPVERSCRRSRRPWGRRPRYRPPSS